MDEDNAWEGLSDGLVSSGDEENYGDASWDLVSSDDEGNSQDASYALDLGDDFGTSDISTWLHENKAAWPPGKTPDEDDWARIRCTGSRSKKTWDLNMAIEAAFREFRLAGTPSSQGAMALAMNLQPEVDSIREHQNSDTIKLRAQINAIKEQESSYKAQVKSLPK
ncbi:hypothetical protein HYE67_009063 [Fusarium culmorum]|uniref:Uncharacterized protein n=1 Tax=Fusarium culmorum TaxID=5516 RepID=A0A2T4H687_FUSCU|nr:hypothetical protein FCULG_00003774 [Fusarium culmorum]QPC66832.1 hypothetical protein HYE67_009063 [Fusarium culmorum]